MLDHWVKMIHRDVWHDRGMRIGVRNTAAWKESSS